jgi:hypothetical protein
MDITLQELKTMKAKQLRRLIREAINEVLAEITKVTSTTNPGEAAEIAKAEKVKPEDVKAAIDQARASGKSVNVAEGELDEMAARPKGFRLADPNFDTTPYADKRISGVSMTDIINFFRENPGAEKSQLQAQVGFVRPQIANAVVNGLLDAGVLVKLGAGGEVEPARAAGEEEEETVTGVDAFLVGNADLSKYFSAASNDDEGNEEDFNAEEVPTAGDIAGKPVSTSSMSDEDYEAFMKYDELKQRLDATKSNIIKMKRSKGGVAGDIRDTSSSDIERLQALKKSLEDKISALVAGSDYLKKKTGQEVIAPEIEDIEDEETLAEYEDRMYEIRKLQQYAGIRK